MQLCELADQIGLWLMAARTSGTVEVVVIPTPAGTAKAWFVEFIGMRHVGAKSAVSITLHIILYVNNSKQKKYSAKVFSVAPSLKTG